MPHIGLRLGSELALGLCLDVGELECEGLGSVTRVRVCVWFPVRCREKIWLWFQLGLELNVRERARFSFRWLGVVEGEGEDYGFRLGVVGGLGLGVC